MNTLEELGHCADVPLAITVELDRKSMTLREVLQLRRGSVLKMKRSAGESITILAGNSLLGFGEIVIIESSMGVRITDFNVHE